MLYLPQTPVKTTPTRKPHKTTPACSLLFLTLNNADATVISGKISDLTSAATLSAEPLPAFLMQIVNDGGLLPHLEKRLRTTS